MVTFTICDAKKGSKPPEISDTHWSNLLYSQLKWQWIWFYWPSAQNNCNKACSSMPTTQWKLDKTKSADQINPDSNIWDCGTSLRLRHSWCLCWWQKWKLMRLSHAAHISHISSALGFPSGPRVPSPVSCTLESKLEMRGETSSVILVDTSLWKWWSPRPHHTAQWHEAACCWLHSRGVGKPTGEVRGGCFGLE